MKIFSLYPKNTINIYGGNFEIINKPPTINACKTTVILFSKLKKAIERIIAKKESNFISGLIFTKYESLWVSK